MRNISLPFPFRKKAAGKPIDEGDSSEEKIYVASQWQLMWWKFKKHHLAMIGGIVTILLYLMALFVEPIAPYNPENQDAKYAFRPPTQVHFVDRAGKFYITPFFYGTTSQRSLETLSLVFTEDYQEVYSLRFFAHGEPYKLWGLFPTNIHLFGTADPDAKFFLLGADKQGRDMFSRIIYGSRISMSVGLLGVVLSFIFGIMIGGISGYYGGTLDVIIQRVIEFLRSIPTIPLWMALSAALPANWPPVQMYFGITLILSLIGWTGLARVVRGRFLALREEDFVMAAKISGSPELRIIFRHMVPSFFSHIIAALTLAVPDMILSETALSFLGLGLRYPAISWGVLLQEAQNIRAVASAPWLMLPGAAVVLAVLALNFLGDGLRDAADPYGR